MAHCTRIDCNYINQSESILSKYFYSHNLFINKLIFQTIKNIIYVLSIFMIIYNIHCDYITFLQNPSIIKIHQFESTSIVGYSLIVKVDQFERHDF